MVKGNFLKDRSKDDERMFYLFFPVNAYGNYKKEEHLHHKCT